MSNYNFIPISIIDKNMAEIKRLKVSVRARERNQFLDMYRKYGTKLPAEWIKKRNGFIARSYAAYLINPTKRRQLALLCWAFAV